MLLPYLEKGRIEAGCDEAGRGCLAGPVFAAAVILPEGYRNELLNILQASFLAMHRAVAALGISPEHLLIDGNRFNPYPNIPHTCIVKGDGKMMSIAAASILAKTHRDEFMEKIHVDYPMYGWNVNKGYPTKAHRAAIEAYGSSPWHRRSFRLLAEPSLFPEL